ncbi:MAG: thiol reductant exporter subunit CydD [Actinomycetota bacterium]|jgi:thiol reductant ABC exporter CydC subunit
MITKQAGFFAIVFASLTMLSAVGLVATGGWLISAAALMPPMMTLQVATVSVRFFGIARGFFRWSERVVSHESALQGTVENRVKLWNAAAVLGPRGIWRLRGSDALDRLTADTDLLQDSVVRVRTPFFAAVISATLLVIVQTSFLQAAGLLLSGVFILSGFVLPRMTIVIEDKVARDSVNARNALSAEINTVIGHSDELRISGASARVLTSIAENEKRRVQIESKASAWVGLSGALNGIAAGAAVFISLVFSATAYLSGELQGSMIAVIVLLPWASAEIIATFGQVATAQSRVRVAQERIDELLNQAEAYVRQAKPACEKILASPSELSIQDLAVSWSDRKVVDGISFSLRRGQTIALTGPSGSGKSSIAAAILRLVEHEGVVTLDDTPVDHLTDFRVHVSALLQTTHVFSMSLRENLLIANGNASDVEIVTALSRAGLDAWFERLPRGLDTLIGQSGQPMSGGEVQRLGVARLLLSQAAFIVLDEPTEHLDEKTASEVWATIMHEFRDRGLLLITHDQSMADDCDYVLRLQNGQLVRTLSL